MTEPSKKPMDRSKVILVIVSVIAAIIIIFFYLEKLKREKGFCQPGWKIWQDPETGWLWCRDNGTILSPDCGNGLLWSPPDGKCVSECPPGWIPDTASGRCIKTQVIPTRGLMTGRLIDVVTSLPIPDYEVHIELNGIPFDMTKTIQDGTFLFDILIEGSLNVGIRVFIGGGASIIRIATVTGDHNFGDFVFGSGPPDPGPIEFNRVYQVREQIQQLPFDPAFPFDSWWKVACDAIDLTGESGAWKSNIFYHDWGQNDCPGQEGIPDDKPYFLFRRNDGIYFLIQEGKDLYESWEVGGPGP